MEGKKKKSLLQMMILLRIKTNCLEVIDYCNM